MTKIIIEVKSGFVQAIFSNNPDVAIVVVDYDCIESSIAELSQLAPDSTFNDGQAHELYTDATDPVEMEIKDELKRIKF